MKDLKDAKRKCVFEITEEDIANAKPRDKNFCVIACAMKEMIGVKAVEVGSTTVRVTNENGIYRYATTPLLKKALTQFDETGEWNLPVGVYSLKPHVGRMSLAGINEHNTKRPNRRRNHPKTGRNRLRKVSPRVVEFAKIRREGRPDFDNLDVLAAEGL